MNSTGSRQVPLSGAKSKVGTKSFAPTSAIRKPFLPKEQRPVTKAEMDQFAPYLHAMRSKNLDARRAAHRHAYLLEFPVDVFGAPDEDAMLDHFNSATELWDRCVRTNFRAYPYAYYLPWFRSMSVEELANAVRTWGNMPEPMVAAGTVAYKERKREVDLIPRYQRPPAYVARHVEEVGPNGETAATHDFVTEKHKTGGKGQLVAAGTWVRRQASSEGA